MANLKETLEEAKKILTTKPKSGGKAAKQAGAKGKGKKGKK